MFWGTLEEFQAVYRSLSFVGRSTHLITKHKRRFLKWLAKKIDKKYVKFLPILEEMGTPYILAFVSAVKEQPAELSLNDVIGREKEVAWLKQRIEVVLSQRRYRKETLSQLGEGEGILVYGPPGTGKTYMCKALASHYGLFFLELVNDLGVSPNELKEVMNLAKRLEDALLFVDDAEMIIGNRKYTCGDNILKAFLSAFSEENIPFFSVLSTNYPERIDPAIVRAGRFGGHLYIPPPSKEQRKQILSYYLKGVPSESVDLNRVAEATEFFSPAELKEIVRQALKQAVSSAMGEGKKEFAVTTEHLLLASEKIKPVAISWYIEKRKWLDDLEELFPEVKRDVEEKMKLLSKTPDPKLYL